MNRRIEVKISPTVTAEQRQDPRFVKLLKDTEMFVNCSCSKCTRWKQLISLHEAAHAYYAKKAGASEIMFYGPTMYWDSRINPKTGQPYDCPSISRSAVGWICGENTSAVDNIKVSVAGYIVRREMSEEQNDEIAISMDIDGARGRFDLHFGTGDEDFKKCVHEAEETVIKDLQSPAVRKEIWAEAKRFQREIFPAPKLTSGLLRARRLGWMQ
jgi:hypothetical protein